MAKISNRNRTHVPYGSMLRRLLPEKGVKAAISEMVVKLMDYEVPTTSHYITEKQKTKVRSLLRPGDLLLETNNEYPGWQTMEKFLFHSDWTHAAIYMGRGKVAQATSDGEGFDAAGDLEDFLDSYHIAIYRPQYKTEKDKASVMKYMRDAQGRMYDSAYNTEDESELYCSEAPYHAFRKMPHPINVELEKVLGLTIASPGAFAHHPDFKFIWSSGSSYWRNQATHTPIGIGTLLGTLGLGFLGAKFGYPITAAMAGAVAGTAAAWGLMKRIWPSLDAKKDSLETGE